MQKLFTPLLFFGVIWMPALLSGQVFWQEDFSQGIPADWTDIDLSLQSVNWSYCEGSCDLPGIYIPAFRSTTAENGYALLDALQYGNQEDDFFNELTTPPIECSNINEAYLQFQTAISTFSLNPAEHVKVFILGDNSEEVLELQPFPVLITDDIPQYTPIESINNQQAYYVTFDISSIVQIAETIQIRWQWEGDYEHFWAIDDVLLSTTHPAMPEDALWFSDFAFGSQGWTSNTVSGPDSMWQWVAGGDVSRAFSVSGIPFSPQTFAFIHSQTASNGAMVFNADYMTTQGEPPSPENPIPQYVCELISPIINLPPDSGPFEVRFSQLARMGNLAINAPPTPEGAKFITSFSYSLDGGTNWSPPYDANPYVTPSTSVFRYLFEDNQFRISIPEEAAGSNQFRIKFTWAGDFYFWVIDDVALVKRPEYDMTVNRNFIAMMPNLVTPASQVTETPLLADIENIGSEPAQEVVEKIHILRADDGEIVHVDSLEFETAPVDTLIENILFDHLVDVSDINQEGFYHGFYSVEHDQTDHRPENDTLNWWFEISENTFAKENGFTRDISPSERVNYTYGNIFYVPNGDGWYARDITFGISRAETLQSAARNVEVRLFKWDGDENEDNMANLSELEELSVNYHIFENTQSTAIIRVPVAQDEQGVPLENNTFYIAAVRYVYTNPPLMRMLVNDTIDYQATVFAGQQAGLPQYASALDVGNSGEFNTLGFGYNIVPMVRLHISQSPNSVDHPTKAFLPLNVYPNPCNHCEELSVTLPKAVSYSDSKLTITDMSGKRVIEEKLTRFPKKHFTFAARYLEAGAYIIAIENEEAISIAKLIVTE